VNLGTLCYIVGFVIAAVAVVGQGGGYVGQDLRTVLIVLMLICLAPLVSGVRFPEERR
jgi:hypothetical protein